MNKKTELEKKAKITLKRIEGGFNYRDSLYIRGLNITSLPDNLTVGGDLDLRNTGITSLPDNLTVGGSLNLRDTGITSLPNDLTVGRDLDLRNNGITYLPDNITVGGSIDLRYTGIISLPDNLIVGGFLDLRDTSITSLPDDLTVGGCLDICSTKISSLPDNLTVGGYLDISLTNINSLPDNLTVGGDLYHEYTSVKDTSKVKRGSVDFFEWKDGAYIKADGIFSKVVSRKGNVYRVRKIGRSKIAYLITDGSGKWSYGETLKEAKKDLIYKLSHADKSKYIGYDLNTEVTFEEGIEMYRVITRACAFGVKKFVETNLDEVKQRYKVSEIISLTEGRYGHEKFLNFFSK